jgi:hypothetical protein
VFLYIAFWRTIVQQADWLGSQATIAPFAVAALVVAATNVLTAAVRPPEEQQNKSAQLHLESHSAPSAHGAPMFVASSRRSGASPATECGDHIWTRPKAALAEGRLMSADENLQAILNSPSYRLAELDTDFLQRDELRPVRLELELLKPEMALTEQGVHSTIVIFGGTQIVAKAEAEQRFHAAQQALAAAPDNDDQKRKVERAARVLAKSGYYDAAREFARLVSSTCQNSEHCDFVIVTGGGPGIMEAANRGAYDVGGKSIGLNVTLPAEQAPNPYITPELCFQFHYFALRKMHFLFRAKALVVFPGGFGTLDELFDALTLRQTERMQQIPIILYGKEYWDRVIDFQFLADEGVVRDEHLELFSYAETPQEAWETVVQFHGIET